MIAGIECELFIATLAGAEAISHCLGVTHASIVQAVHTFLLNVPPQLKVYGAVELRRSPSAHDAFGTCLPACALTRDCQ